MTAKKKVLLVGEAISKHGQEPLVGKASRWLAYMMEMNHIDFLERTVRVNLMSKPTSSWPFSYARTAARRMFERRAPDEYHAVVLLGRKVQAACCPVLMPGWDGDERPCALAGYWGPTPVYIIPHPSGLCRWWNDPNHRRIAGQLLRHAFA